MNDKWAVAFEPDLHGDGVFMWARTTSGDIAVFKTKTEAQQWALTCPDVPESTSRVVFVRIPSRT